MKIRSRVKTAGFTLLEVMVAMGITAIIGVMAYASLSSALEAMEGNEAQSKRLNNLNMLFAILSRDLRQVVPRPVGDEFGDGQEAAFFAPENALIALRFSRTGWENPRPEVFQRSSLQRVAYLLEGDKLIRESWYALDRPTDSEPVRVVMLENVNQLKLKFLQPAASGGPAKTVAPMGGDWRNSWPYPLPELGDLNSVGYIALPLAVEITFELEGLGEIKRLFELPEVDNAS